MLRFPAFENQTLKRSEWALASDLALASWLKLATQAAIAENGGRFAAAAHWDDRAWSIMAGVTAAGVEAAVGAGICKWEDGALLVIGYEMKAETIVQQRREHGRLSPGRPPLPKGTGGNLTDNQTGNRVDNQTGNHKGNHAKKALSSPPLSLPSLSLPSLTLPGEADSSEVGSADSKPVFTFPISGKGIWDAAGEERIKSWGVSGDYHAELVAAFPGADVSAEYAKARTWLLANPRKQKTERGMKAFLYGWMERAQNGGSRNGTSPRGVGQAGVAPAYPPSGIQQL